VAEGEADQAVVCCWTGTGAAIAANKVPGVRAALCADAYTARGARRWNDANALALSLRTLSGPVLGEILDAWFAARPSEEAGDRENVAHVGALERAAATGARDTRGAEDAKGTKNTKNTKGTKNAKDEKEGTAQ
jgi:ribose 5-phosphate isomerase B